MKQTNKHVAVALDGFGNRVAALRKKTGMDKKQFADKSGISYKHYFNIENNVTRPSLNAYIAICRAGGVNELPLLA